mmetsp:Transcript_13577/g.47313  ORF Transcript_13577/g.47313 Transcript_13577/m.47313 type:complete len:222 (-) Transcript_13577:225-890(-)
MASTKSSMRPAASKTKWPLCSSRSTLAPRRPGMSRTAACTVFVQLEHVMPSMPIVASTSASSLGGIAAAAPRAAPPSSSTTSMATETSPVSTGCAWAVPDSPLPAVVDAPYPTSSIASAICSGKGTAPITVTVAVPAARSTTTSRTPFSRPFTAAVTVSTQCWHVMPSTWMVTARGSLSRTSRTALPSCVPLAPPATAGVPRASTGAPSLGPSLSESGDAS